MLPRRGDHRSSPLSRVILGEKNETDPLPIIDAFVVCDLEALTNRALAAFGLGNEFVPRVIVEGSDILTLEFVKCALDKLRVCKDAVHFISVEWYLLLQQVADTYLQDLFLIFSFSFRRSFFWLDRSRS